MPYERAASASPSRSPPDLRVVSCLPCPVRPCPGAHVSRRPRPPSGPRARAAGATPVAARTLLSPQGIRARQAPPPGSPQPGRRPGRPHVPDGRPGKLPPAAGRADVPHRRGRLGRPRRRWVIPRPAPPGSQLAHPGRRPRRRAGAPPWRALAGEPAGQPALRARRGRRLRLALRARHGQAPPARVRARNGRRLRLALRARHGQAPAVGKLAAGQPPAGASPRGGRSRRRGRSAAFHPSAACRPTAAAHRARRPQDPVMPRGDGPW